MVKKDSLRNENANMTIGDRIRFFRKVRGMTQVQLASASNIHPVSIRKYETNKMTPQPAHIAMLANALDVSYFALSDFNPSFFRLNTIGDLLGFIIVMHKLQILVMRGERYEDHLLKSDTIRFYPNDNLVRMFYPVGDSGSVTNSAEPISFKFRFENIEGRFADKLLIWEAIYDQYCQFYPDPSNAEDMNKKAEIISRLEELELELQQSMKPILCDPKTLFIEDYIYGDNSVRDPFGKIKEPVTEQEDVTE